MPTTTPQDCQNSHQLTDNPVRLQSVPLFPFLPQDFNHTFKMLTVLPQLLGVFTLWGENSWLWDAFMPRSGARIPWSMTPLHVLQSAVLHFF